jgi:anthranilate phosphoribosyltransferase
VAEAGLAPTMADVLVRLGIEHVLVFHGADGMDELTVSGPSRVIEVADGRRTEYTISPAELGLALAPPEAVQGGEPQQNAALAREVLGGAKGPHRDVVLLNSAAALRAAGMCADWKQGIGLAAEAIDSGRAGSLLDRWVKASQEPV